MERAEVKVLVEDLHKVLDAFAEKHGLESASFKGVTFDETGFKTTLRVDQKLDKEDKIKDFDLKARSMGLPNGLYLKAIHFQGENFVIQDINTRAKKYPILAKGSNGGSYKLPRSAVK